MCVNREAANKCLLGLAESGPLGAMVLDSDMRVHAWNCVLAQWAGISARQAIGRTLDELFPGALTSLVRKRLAQSFRERSITVLSASLHRSFLPIQRPSGKLGERMIQRTMILPTVDGSGNCLVQIEDVTVSHLQLEELRGEKKKLQGLLEQLASAHVKLEQQAIELDAKNHLLAEARRRAEAATLAKSAFLAHMSHELRTPLTAILGFAEMLLDDAPEVTESQASSLDTIRRNGEHLLQLINDVLDLSKIEAGAVVFRHEPWNPVQLVAEVVRLLKVRAEGKRITLTWRDNGLNDLQLIGDPLRVRQVLINLVGNAIKFTHRGGVRVVLSQVVDRSGAPMLRIDVVDSGEGISAESLSKLFKPFSQVSTSDAPKQAGAGLGLAISKRLAQKMGGRISVKSAVGRGSRFRVTLPLHRLPSTGISPDLCENAGYGGGKEIERPLAGMRLLLAEDGVDNQRLLDVVLRKAGAQLTIVDNGKKALESALAAERAGSPFDIVLMDMQMPVMDGYDATRTLRSCGYEHPIVAVTAHVMSGDREKCLEAGCTEYETKPIDRVRLVRLLSKYRHAATRRV